MKKSKILNAILIILVILFTISVVNKTFQNDTFFDIPIGQYILENGIDMMDHFTWHTELSYTYSHWTFGVVEAVLYNLTGFTGLYIMVLILSALISVTIFILLKKTGTNNILAFFITLVAVYFAQGAFAARAQIVTFLLFIIEFYCIERLVKTNKLRYSIILIIIPIIIANVHASVWVIYFVFYLPYIAEFIIYHIINKLKLNYRGEKLIIEKNSMKKLLITMMIAILTGLITPLGNVPYIFMTKNITGLSSQYISELQPITITDAQWTICLLILSIYIGIITFTKTKVKLTDILYILGFTLMSLAVNRSIFYLIFTGAILIGRLLTEFLKEYKINFFERFEEIVYKPKNMAFFTFIFLAISVYGILGKISIQYVDLEKYPVYATEYILENIDIENMRIYNSFNYGSYLELNGIPAFIDSRSEVYCEEFNDTTILEDVMNVEDGAVSYKEIFAKYDITHVLIYNTSLINIYIVDDSDYQILYQDDTFTLYEKVN